MKNLGVNRKFRPEAYQMNDGLGKKVILTYLKGKGHIILDTRENYSFDIESEKDGHTYFSEVEMKNQWRGDWNTSWKEIRIPYRKHKLLDRYKNMSTDTSKKIFLNFYIIRTDCEYAWKIKDHQLTEERAKDTWLGNARRTEPFYHIPYEEAELIKLKLETANEINS
tara:strand:- start:692 stop:1192 length:501 start_codon:yes stop_codon:yes gene_type:complete